jgi:hypothetical protein
MVTCWAEVWELFEHAVKDRGLMIVHTQLPWGARGLTTGRLDGPDMSDCFSDSGYRLSAIAGLAARQ